MTELDGHHVNSYKYQSPNSPVIGISRGGAAGVTLNTGRTTLTLPSPRQQHQVQHQRDRRSLPCQVKFNFIKNKSIPEHLAKKKLCHLLQVNAQ